LSTQKKIRYLVKAKSPGVEQWINSDLLE